ncbi:hypothetical protein [Tepidiforma thermophila]|uniref:hypothetical protein n=1 Tax=Tepidiforma thermophila (strain KCTC 52669 / CGMCC 1.13589 / G233) TaxID=2761530 RepID=UPI001054BC84|nr:hypothetical protein [Tepidiforma thermophila]
MPPRRANPFAREHQHWLTLAASAASVAAFAIGWAAYGSWTGNAGGNDDPGPPPAAVPPSPVGAATSAPSPTAVAAGGTPPGATETAPAPAPTRKSRAS